MRRVGHVARIGDKKNAFRILLGNPEEKRPLGRPRVRWDNIKLDLQKVGWGHGLDRCNSGYGQVAGTFKCGNEPSGSTKCVEFLD
jgi:hypothetical protein